jgi:hypothetical protein
MLAFSQGTHSETGPPLAAQDDNALGICFRLLKRSRLAPIARQTQQHHEQVDEVEVQ